MHCQGSGSWNYKNVWIESDMCSLQPALVQNVVPSPVAEASPTPSPSHSSSKVHTASSSSKSPESTSPAQSSSNGLIQVTSSVCGASGATSPCENQ